MHIFVITDKFLLTRTVDKFLLLCYGIVYVREYGMFIFDNCFTDSSSVANNVHIASGHTSSRAHCIIYLNSTQPHKYPNNKIRLTFQ